MALTTVSQSTNVLSTLAEELKSKVTRSQYFNRLIDIDQHLRELGGGESGGWIQWLEKGAQKVFGIGKALVGFGVATHNWLFGDFSFSDLLSTIQEWTISIYTFDWNQTDKELKSQIDSNNLSLFTTLGNFLGTGTVWGVSAGIASIAALKFPVLGGEVAMALVEEGSEEIVGSFKNLLAQWYNVSRENTIMKSLLSARKAKLFGLSPVKESKEPWIMGEALDKLIKKVVKGKELKAFVLGFKDGVEDSFWEMGYVVANTLDDYYDSQSVSANSDGGPPRLIEIAPDAAAPNERIIIGGDRQDDVIQSAQSYLNNHNLVANRDLGTVVGQPFDEWYRARPQVRKLTITFCSVKEPPFITADGKPAKRVTYSIPDAKLGLTWVAVKTAAKKFLWGKHRCTAILSNGRQMAVYGASKEIASEKVHELMKLSSASIVRESVTEETNVPTGRIKHPTQVFPHSAVMLIRKSSAVVEGNLTTIDGKNWESSQVRVELWREEEPPNFVGFK